MRKLLINIDKTLAWFENSLIVLIVTVMVSLAFFQVILRNFFDSGFLWGDIFLRHLVLWVGFIGASLATRDEKHIRMDTLNRLLSEKMLPYVHMIVNLFTVAVCLVLAYAGYNFVMMEFESNTILFNDVPAWIFQIMIPVGFLLIGFRFLLKVLEKIFDKHQGNNFS